jgi:DNA-binding XRE family transcriptional regulator
MLNSVRLTGSEAPPPQAAAVAEGLGFTQVFSIDGGTDEWARLGLPIEIPPAPAPSPTLPDVLPAELEAHLPELDAVIGNNLRELRTARQLSLDATARLTGLSRTLLGQIELGTNTPSVGVVFAANASPASASKATRSTSLNSPSAHSCVGQGVSAGWSGKCGSNESVMPGP